jgi:hypothetical protein
VQRLIVRYGFSDCIAIERIAMKRLLSLVLVSTLVAVAGCSSMPGMQAAPAAPAQSVSFVAPADGATVTSPFLVKFAVTGMQVAPAATFVPDTGHHHLLINAAEIPAMGAIPADAQHLHFGKAQTETTLTLPPGTYKLTMQFGNGYHQAYGPAMTKTITVKVL